MQARRTYILSECKHYTSIQRFPNCGARPLPGAMLVFWGAQVICMRDIFILNEIWVQDKIYTSVGTLIGLNILLTTYKPAQAPNCKQHILSSAKVRFLSVSQHAG
jgi:hypothetical protein